VNYEINEMKDCQMPDVSWRVVVSPQYATAVNPVSPVRSAHTQLASVVGIYRTPLPCAVPKGSSHMLFCGSEQSVCFASACLVDSINLLCATLIEHYRSSRCEIQRRVGDSHGLESVSAGGS
jgi:hypothetical protein